MASISVGLKSEAVPPQVNMAGVEANKAPLLEDVMQLARLGDIEPMRRLFEQGKSSADFKDSEGITPLHVCNTNICILF
jgi:hypothetical protein